MEKIEVIEEKKMIKRLISKFLIYILVYGLLYLACMVFFIMLAILLQESLKSTIIMTLINIGINIGFVMLLSNGAICNAFDGINTVDVPTKSRRRILKIAASIMTIVMIIITFANFIAFHSLFTSKIQTNTYRITSSKSINNIKLETLSKHGAFSNVKLVKESNGMNTYEIFSRSYNKEAIITFTVMIVMNIVVIIMGINYENNLLKRYLVPSK